VCVSVGRWNLGWDGKRGEEKDVQVQVQEWCRVQGAGN